jgi:peptidoglycan-associated lipoprotein
MFKKRALWTILIGVLYVGIMGAGTCGKNAKNQIDAAEVAIEDARQAQAQEYSPVEFTSAEESLLLAQEQYDAIKFRKAEESAVTAESQARIALQRSLEQKARTEEENRIRREEEEAAMLAYNQTSLFGATIEEPTEQERASMALHDVHFLLDSFSLSDSAQQILLMNIEWLKSHPTVKIEIEGHCDDRGTEEYNLSLGAKRAKIVVDFLVSAGINEGRIRTISYGESVPIDPGQTDEAWAKNRRAHFAAIH